MQDIYTISDVRRILMNNQYQHTIIYKALLSYAKIRYADLKKSTADELRERANYYKKVLLDDMEKLTDFVNAINKKIVSKRILSLSKMDADERISTMQTIKRLSKRDRRKIYECMYGNEQQIDDDILCRLIVMEV